MGNQYMNKSMYIPSLTEPHTPTYDPHYPSTPQEYGMGYPPSQTPRQEQAKNQQWIVQQLVKFHMFNNDENKNEGKSVGKEPISLNYTKSLDPSFHTHDASSMKYNLIRSSSLIDQQIPDYSRQRKMNSSMSSLHTEDSYSFQELSPSLYDAFDDKLIEPEEPVFQDSYDRVPPSPSFATQTHTFSPGALAFYPPGHFNEPPEDKAASLFSSLPASLHHASYEPPSPHLFYGNKIETTPLEYDAFAHTDLYHAKQSLEVDKLSSRTHNKSPTQYNPLLVPGSSSKSYAPGYMPSYMVDGNSNNSIGMKGDLLTNSLPTGIGLERSDAAWLFLTGLSNRVGYWYAIYDALMLLCNYYIRFYID